MSLYPNTPFNAQYINTPVVYETTNVDTYNLTQDGQGLKIENLTTGGYVEISPSGIELTNDGVNIYNVNLIDIVPLETPPNSTTLKVNDTIELNDGTNNALIGIDGSGNLLIDPSNNVVIGSGSSLTASTFIGALTGNADTATQIRITPNGNNAVHYLTFSDTNTTGNINLHTNSGILCNPFTDTITATTFAGDLNGTSTYSLDSKNNPMLLSNGRAGGLVAVSIDTYGRGTSANTIGANATNFFAVYLSAGQVVSSLGFVPNNALTTPLATIELGLYTGAGILVASTAPLTNATSFTTGTYNFFVVNSGTPYTITTSGFYYLAVGTNGTAGNLNFVNLNGSASLNNYPNTATITNGDLSLLRSGIITANGGVNLPANLTTGYSIDNTGRIYLLGII